MNKSSLQVSYADLLTFHSAWERVRAINDLYPELLMNGKQADRLKPFSSQEFRNLTDLRDRMGNALSEANKTPPEGGYPHDWEVTEPHQEPRRKSIPPVI